MRFELIGVPYTSMARPGGIADAIDVLRSAGLADRVGAVGDVHIVVEASAPDALLDPYRAIGVTVTCA